MKKSKLSRLTQIGFSLFVFILNIPLFILLFIMYKTKLIDYRSAAQFLALIPDWIGGLYIRRFWYRSTLKFCGPHLQAHWMSTIYEQSTIGKSCHIGSNTAIGWAEIGDDVLIGSYTIIVSGTRQHGLVLSDIPMRQQTDAQKSKIRIGNDVWIGAACVIGADIADGVIVGMGSIVVHPLDEKNCIYAGNPARKIRVRTSDTENNFEEM